MELAFPANGCEASTVYTVIGTRRGKARQVHLFSIVHFKHWGHSKYFTDEKIQLGQWKADWVVGVYQANVVQAENKA